MSMSHDQIRDQIAKLGPWFATYDFGHGLRTISARGDIEKYFAARAERLFTLLDQFFVPSETTILDVGCADGYFSNMAASRGYKKVLGVDYRAEHIARAKFATSVLGHGNVDFVQGNVYELDDVVHEPYDVVLFQGLLYHLANPVAAMRQIERFSTRAAFIGTWTAGQTDGILFTLQREDPADYIQGDETISMVPTQKALFAMSIFFGFPVFYELDLNADKDCKWGSDLEWREILCLRGDFVETAAAPPPPIANQVLRWSRHDWPGPSKFPQNGPAAPKDVVSPAYRGLRFLDHLKRLSGRG